MNRYTLPPGIVKVCAAGTGGQNGTVSFSPVHCGTDDFRQIPGGQQDEAHRLAAAIKVNVKHPRRPSVATLLRQFDLNISEKTFRRYKREYCYTLALEAGLFQMQALSTKFTVCS